ncbi:MAG TPA: sugar phosphate isomerase/epimerase family protein [Humibacter sp.]|nr:sugar phosphate isomerase/epimerase family protein [Humibacter sp.]
MEYTAQSWPIAAAMINFSVAETDPSVQDAPAEGWASTLRQVRRAGFDHLDPTDSWLRVADLSSERRREFASVVAETGLAMVSLSTARRSVIDPERGERNLAYCHRVLEVCAELGIGTVSIGLLPTLTPRQQRALWFWTAPGQVDPDDPEVWAMAVRRLRELGDHAASIGITIGLEMYEDTYLGTADSAVRLVQQIDSPNVGLNPDIGNLVRLHRPIEHWRSMIEKTAPYATYWHVKNYSRTEDESTGAIHTAPTSMELGVIDYRFAIGYAIEHGYRGAFLTEHYGGDGLSVSATNREYIRRLLPNFVSAA